MSVSRLTLHVVERIQLSSALLRLVLKGDLADYPEPQAGAPLKIWVPTPEGEVARTYTVREFDRAAQRMTIDFVLHDQPGPACDWARQAGLGATLTISGPKAPRAWPDKISHYCFAGDLSALPAIAAQVEQLDPQAEGWVALQIQDLEERVYFTHPAGVQVQWLLPDGQPQQLQRWVQRLDLKPDTLLWVAAEHDEVVGLRDWARQDLGWPRSHVHAVPYWRRDVDEEIYHDQRHQVMADDE